MKAVTKLAEVGPSEREVRDVARHIRLLLRHDKIPIATRYSASGVPRADVDASKLQLLYAKLSRYSGQVEVYCRRPLTNSIHIRHPYTAIAAMEETIALTIEDPYARTTLKEGKEVRESLGRLSKSADPEICDWSSKTLYAVEKESVPQLWSNAITGSMSWPEMQRHLDRNVRLAGNKRLFEFLAKYFG